MILTEIKIKDLNVRISEFEDPIFDKNILPIFTTPLILKEVAARKRSKYKIETLNPEKKLTFKVVSFNEVVEELAARINKIAVDLEPHYYIDPSDYNSLPLKVKEIMDKFKLWEERIEVINASKRVKISTIKKKKLILYASSRKKETIRPILNKKDILNYINFDFKFDHLNSSEGEVAVNDLFLFSGWIPKSKGALMLLEDQGWDLDLLSNTNSISQRIRKLRPYKLRIIRRFRRLRRLRLMSVNLYLHRSKNVEKIVKDQECQGRNQSILRLIKVYSPAGGGTMPIKSLSSIINSRIKKLRNVNVMQPSSTQPFVNEAGGILNKNIQLLKQSPNSISTNLSNNFLIKHTDNKLNFIVNWIGDNLYSKELAQPLDNRLNNKNISNMFLMMQNHPIQLPSTEKTEESVDAVLPLINKNQKMLNQITLLKAAKNKSDAITYANKSPWEKMRADMLAGTYTRKKYKKYKKMQKRQRYFNKVRFFSINTNSKLIKHTSALPCLMAPAVPYMLGWKGTTNLENIITSKTANQLRFASNVVHPSQSMHNAQSIGENKLDHKGITSKFKVIPFPQHKNSELTKYLKAIESKINNWNKKKNLSTNLLHKTSLRFAKSQLILKKNNLLSNEYFSLNSMQRKLIKDKLSKILYKNYLNKLKSSTNFNSWKKLTTLLKPSASYALSPLLFWTIVKLYSTSFNPMLNSLNNNYFTVPGFFGQGIAQIKLTSRMSTDAEREEEKNSNNTLSFNASSRVASLSHNLLNNIIVKGAQSKDINNASLSKATVNLSHINNTNTEISNNISAIIKDVDPKQVYLDLRQADNKRFLFLYFIVPIFFSTLKFNSESASVPIRANILNNQIKQLQTLIKLMLNSRSSLRNQWLYNKNVKLNNIPSLPLASISIKKGRNLANQNLITSINGYTDSNFVNKWTATVVDLFKWSALFISQSLTPLKRDFYFYNFIFIKILETRGFLNKNLRVTEKNNHRTKIAPVKFNTLPSQSVGCSALTKINNFSLTNKVVSKTRDVSHEKFELNANKQASITYYPGGRNINDWKNITKAIWQEEYKFNALYKRLKISLNLANNSTNNKSKNLYATIITILKLWEIIKITNIKSVSSFKLQVLFLNYPDLHLHSALPCTRSARSARSAAQQRSGAPTLKERSQGPLAHVAVRGKAQAQINKFANAINLQANLSFKKIKYSIIDSIIKVLDKLHTVPKVKGHIQSPISHKLLFNSTLASSEKVQKVGQQIKFGSRVARVAPHLFNSKFSKKLIPSSKFLNLANKIAPKTIKIKNSFINNYFNASGRRVTTPFYLNYNLTRFINYMDKNMPFIYSINKFKKKKFHFISKEINLFMYFSPPRRRRAQASRNITELISKEQHINTAPLLSIPKGEAPEGAWKIKQNLILSNGIKTITSKNTYNLISERIEINESFNNLVNAKSIIIGKIRSIKLIELIDKMKEEIAIAEKLAALVRVADITDLNLINKKKSRRINSNKYLNKKNIYRSNRIKILQTIKTIKSDLRFEPRLDSNSLSNIPVSLLYYSNLKPAYIKNNNTYVSQEFEKPPVISAYLRELSIYNRETKGIINYFSKIVGYNFNTNTNKISSSIYDLLEASFNAMRCLISKPVFIITPEKITIQLFYFLLVANKNKLKIIRKKFGYRRKRKTYKKNRLKEAKNLNLYSLNEVFPEQLELLCGRLNKVFNKPVELNLTRLHYPSEDTNILVNLIGIIINKIHLARIFKNLFSGSIIKSLTKLKAHKYNDISIIPAFLTGLNIKIAGRIMTQTIRPRQTINLIRRGATASGKINYLNFARLTNKNKRGSYSITISAGQNYFK
jgi:Mitochondrial ribosomal protein (VAR1)